MKKFLSVLLVVAVLASSLVALAACTGADKVLYVYNWEDYIDKDVIKEFEKWYESKTGDSIEVKYSNFDTNETMLTKVGSNSSIDLVCPSEYAVQRLATNGLLLDLTEESIWAGVPDGKVDLWENVNPTISEKVNAAFGDMNLANYFTPYMMGTLGILYNADYVTEDDLECGFGLLWNKANNPKLYNADTGESRIYFKDSIRDAYAATVLYLKQYDLLPEGNSAGGKAFTDLSIEELINCTDDALVARAEEELKEQKKINKGYSVDLDKEYLIDGSAYATLAWSGDALYAIEESNQNLAYFVPEIGSNVWFDGWCILERAENVKEALMFMQFMTQPESCVKNMLEIGYVSAVSKEAIENDPAAKTLLVDAITDGLFISHLDAEEIDEMDEDEAFDAFFEDPIRYQTEDEYEYLGIMKDFGEETDEKMINMWERVKAANNSIWLIVAIIGGIVALCAIAFAVYMLMKASKNKKRRA